MHQDTARKIAVNSVRQISRGTQNTTLPTRPLTELSDFSFFICLFVCFLPIRVPVILTEFALMNRDHHRDEERNICFY